MESFGVLYLTRKFNNGGRTLFSAPKGDNSKCNTLPQTFGTYV